MRKIIYPKYALWIFIYAMLYITPTLYLGVLFEKYLVPEFDPVKGLKIANGNKHLYKLRLMSEIYLNLGLVVVSIYIIREVIDYIIRLYFHIDKHPDRFATLVLSPIVFSQYRSVFKKIDYVLNH